MCLSYLTSFSDTVMLDCLKQSKEGGRPWYRQRGVSSSPSNALHTSPMLEQVRDFPSRGKFIPDAVGVDSLSLCRLLGGEHYIRRMHPLPDARRHPWFLRSE